MSHPIASFRAFVVSGRTAPVLRCRGLFACIMVIAAPVIAAMPGGDAPRQDSEYVSRSWVTDDGVPHNVVERVEQDRTGFLWLATMAGLARFDGQEFKVYSASGATGSHGRNVRDFALLADGTVLFLPATGGISQLKDGVVTPHPAATLLGRESLLRLYAEPSGAVWFEAGQGLARWQEGRLERFGAAEGIDRRLLHFSWAADATGRTWIAGADFVGYYAQGKLVRVNAPAGAVYRVAPARTGGPWIYGNALYRIENDALVAVAGPAWPPARASARCLYEDQAGVLWLASSRAGLFRYDQHRYSSVAGVEPGIEFVTEDREGDLWLATDGGGIRRLRRRSFTLVDVPVTSVTEDARGNVWFAAVGTGLIRRAEGRQDVFPVEVGRVPLHVIAVSAGPDDRLWLSTSAGIFVMATDTPGKVRRIDPSLRNARILLAARDGNVWVAAGARFGACRDDGFHPLPNALPVGEEVTAIAQGESGPVWVGTSRDHLYSLAGETLAPVPLPPEVRGGTIQAIWPERSGTLWLGTTEGLVMVEGERVRRLTDADGLPDTAILQVLEDPAGYLWLATGRGLFRLRRDDVAARTAEGGARLQPVAYGPDQGLHGISPITNEHPAACADTHGTLWFCTYKSGIGIQSARVAHDAPPPPVLLKDIRLDERSIAARDRLSVPAGEHRLEFRFAALSFAAPERVRLRHQLQGFDAGWVDTAPDRVARYAKLPPANYRLRVIACNSEGVWNEQGIEFAVVVQPAWWQTLWFRIIAVLVFAGLVAGLVRYWSHKKYRARLERLERAHALEQERARIARDMHDELGGSVTSINLAVQRLRALPGVPLNGALDTLDHRVRRLSVELERVVWTVSPKHGSLEQLAGFLVRFVHNLLADSSLRCRVRGQEDIPPEPVSPDVQHHVLAVTKEAINNVLKHAHATEVRLALVYAEGRFTLTIEDNGAGFDPAAQEFSDRNGLRNMRTRADELHGTLALRSSAGAGTTVELQVPILATTIR